MTTVHETEGTVTSLHCSCGATWTFKDGAVEYKSGKSQSKQEQGEPWGHGGRPMTLRECMEAEESQPEHSFTYEQMKEHAEGLQRDYDLLLAEYNLLKQEQGEPVGVAHLMQEGFTHCIWSEAFVPVGTKFYTTPQQRTWVGLMRGVRVEGNTVVISVHYGNDAARQLCDDLIKEMNNERT